MIISVQGSQENKWSLLPQGNTCCYTFIVLSNVIYLPAPFSVNLENIEFPFCIFVPYHLSVVFFSEDVFSEDDPRLMYLSTWF